VLSGRFFCEQLITLQWSPNDSGVSEYDRQVFTMRRASPSRGFRIMGRCALWSFDIWTLFRRFSLKQRKTPVNFVMSVRPRVSAGTQWTDFLQICYWRTSTNICQ